MSTGLIYDDRFLTHDTGPGHPERPQRLNAIVDRLKAERLWRRCVHLPFAPADRAMVERIHSADYIDRVREACLRDAPYIDTPDSAIGRESFDVALLAVGGAVAAVDAVVSGSVNNAFCLVRPPGHHAERSTSMGFCLFNNIAIAAERAAMTLFSSKTESRLARIAIVDFDVHHGNGTQHHFETRGDVLVISLHEDPRYQYPGTGFAHEVGSGEGLNRTLNIPLMPDSGDDVYRHAFEGQVLPALNAFEPDMLLVSAGFDAAATDPLGHMQVTTDGFRWMSRALKAAAERNCAGRMVSFLEGGYDLPALAEGVAAHLQTLLQTEP